MSIKNTAALRQILAESIEKVRRDPHAAASAAVIANAAGKMIGSVKVELEYAALRKEKPKIPFLESK